MLCGIIEKKNYNPLQPAKLRTAKSLKILGAFSTNFCVSVRDSRG